MKKKFGERQFFNQNLKLKFGMAPQEKHKCDMENVSNNEENADVLMDWEPPKAQGLYDPQNEHEACGVGFIVAIDGRRNHKVISRSQNKLMNFQKKLYVLCNAMII